MDGWDVKGIEFNRLVGGMINSALLVDAGTLALGHAREV